MATRSIVLAWRIPGTGEPGGLPSMGSHRVGHDWGDLAAAAAASMSVLMLISHCLNYCSFVTSFKIGKCESFNLVLPSVFKTVLVIPGSLQFCMQFRISLSISEKKNKKTKSSINRDFIESVDGFGEHCHLNNIKYSKQSIRMFLDLSKCP